MIQKSWDTFAHYTPGKWLRLVGTGQLAVPRIQTKHNEMAFGHYAAHCWIQTHLELRLPPTSASFLK